MILDEELGLEPDGRSDPRRLFVEFGVTGNPFPPAGQPSGHPHLETSVDREFARAVRSFRDDKYSQVLVVEGTQGVGKTNLLAFYSEELRRRLGEGRSTPYIVLYYSDPERSFEKVINTILLQLRGDFIGKLVTALGGATEDERRAARSAVRNPDVWNALLNVGRSEIGEARDEAVKLCFEWISGQRLLKRHRETLDVTYRLDTVESKTQALRDLIELGARFGVVAGIILLLDELEKQDVATSRTDVVRFLLAIRAMIDALPKHLFLAVALTPVAKNRYFAMVPAVESRVRDVLTINAFKTWDNAKSIYLFYVARGREAGRTEMPGEVQGALDLVDERTAARCFETRLGKARQSGADGLTPRDFLDALHTIAAEAIRNFEAAPR